MKTKAILLSTLKSILILAAVALLTANCDLQGSTIEIPLDQPQAVVETETDTTTEAENQPVAEPETVTELEPVAEPETVTEPEPVAEPEPEPVYVVGDTGPAGGLVFFVNPNYSDDGWHYLEAAPVATEWATKSWGSSGVLVGGTSLSTGSGYENTTLIVSALGTTTTGKAAQLCDTLVEGSHDDWFLPSQDELDLMYDNLHINGLGDFAAIGYWSSSEYSADNAWRQSFSSGLMSNNVKTSTYRVRAIRRF